MNRWITRGVVAAFICLSVTAGAVPFFVEDFESGLGDWWITPAVGGVIDDSGAESPFTGTGSNSLYYLDNTASGVSAPRITRNLGVTLTGGETLSFDFQVTDAGVPQVQFGSDAQIAGVSVMFSTGNEGLGITEPDGIVWFGSLLPLGSWYRATFRLDDDLSDADDTYDLVITDLAGNVRFSRRGSRFAKEVDEITRVRFGNNTKNGTAEYRIDNLCIAQSSSYSNTTFYIDAVGGSDTADGLTEATAWRSFGNLNVEELGEGVEIRLKRDTILRGSLDPLAMVGTSGNPVLIDAYGTGANPVLSGFKELSGWTPSSSNPAIWEVDCPDPVAAFYLDGAKQTLARYPNTGFVEITGVDPDEAVKQFEFQSTQLPDRPYWEDAQAVVRSSRYTMDTTEVATWDAVTSTITVSKKLNPNYWAGYGFYMQNVFEELDAEGEWFYDTAAEKLYFYKPAGISLSNQVCEASVYSTGLRMDPGDQYVTVQNIDFEGYQDYAIYGGESVQHVEVSNGAISRIGHSGIFFDGNDYVDRNADVLVPDIVPVSDITIDGMQIDRCGSYGLLVEFPVDSAITNNRVSNCDISALRFIAAKDTVASHNEFLNSGWSGASVRAREGLVFSDNLIDGYCLLLDDGGGIYTGDNGPSYGLPAYTTGPNFIERNIVMNGFGNLDGTKPGTKTHVAGIYLDDNTKQRQVFDNIVVRPGTENLMIHNSREHVVRRNVFFDAKNYNVWFREDYKVGDWWPGGENISANTFTDNICYMAILQDYPVYNISDYSVYNNVEGFRIGSDNNLYINPSNTNVISRSPNGQLSEEWTLSEWQAGQGQELNSAFRQDSGLEILVNTNRTASQDFPLGPGEWVDLEGNVLSSPVTVPAWSSLIIGPSPLYTVLVNEGFESLNVDEVLSGQLDSFEGTGNSGDNKLVGQAYGSGAPGAGFNGSGGGVALKFQKPGGSNIILREHTGLGLAAAYNAGKTHTLSFDFYNSAAVTNDKYRLFIDDGIGDVKDGLHLHLFTTFRHVRNEGGDIFEVANNQWEQLKDDTWYRYVVTIHPLDTALDTFDLAVYEAGVSNPVISETALPFGSDIADIDRIEFQMDSDAAVGEAFFDNLYLARHEEPPAVDGYAAWIGGFAVGSATGMFDDAEPDGLNNLTEYALGGDPGVDDAAAILPMAGTMEQGGTNWLVYVHRQRDDAAARGLVYTVQSCGDLEAANWTNGIPVVYFGQGPLTNGFLSVTNRLDTDTADVYFLRLQIEQQ